MHLLRQHLATQALAQAGNSRSLFTLALGGRLFVGLALAQFGDQAILFDGAAEAPNRDIERLVFFKDNSGHDNPGLLNVFLSAQRKTRRAPALRSSAGHKAQKSQKAQRTRAKRPRRPEKRELGFNRKTACAYERTA
ncbi:hypothetical protein BURKHO8Y_240388 [Burkholderia sp. 8Y]|nr:hypothetical protein BURKHO8Y_240388 [Burkholderia sp. 8Y]